MLNYKLGVKLGLNPVKKLQAVLPVDKIFMPPDSLKCTDLSVSKQWYTTHCYFGWYCQESTSTPDWHRNPFNDENVHSPEEPWWSIPDFDARLGDIKTVWEASRFDWVIRLAQHAAQGDENALERLNAWLADWCVQNPAYKGPNWKCGQEASIRVMHLVTAAWLLDQHKSISDALKQLIRVHLQRILPTINYAIAQDNNHGTSEAAALYIGGVLLSAHGDSDGKKYQIIGLKWLENRAKHLIEKDGSFSQYSVNYHRVMLDTYSMAEYWRQNFGLPVFSDQLYNRLSAATNWLFQITQMENGDVPNLGANDGAYLFPLSGTDYRDYRPSVQLASVLFNNKRAYCMEGTWDYPLLWLGIGLPEKCMKEPVSTFFPDGGCSCLRAGNAFLLFNIPRFRFRPGQADALHVDLWLNGVNLLRDGGTYSYNAGDDIIDYFGGTESHNTIQFDDRDQMPRLSRFLFGAWLKPQEVIPVSEKDGKISSGATYEDFRGVRHQRLVRLSDKQLKVIDNVSGFCDKAVLRWRLQPGEWIIQNTTVRNGDHEIKLSCDVPIIRFEIIQGWESRYYFKKTPIPVLEVEIHQLGKLVTEYYFDQ